MKRISCQSIRISIRHQRRRKAVLRMMLWMAGLVLVQGFLCPGQEVQTPARFSHSRNAQQANDRRMPHSFDFFRIRQEVRRGHDYSATARLSARTSSVSEPKSSSSRRRKRRTWRQYFPKLQKYFENHGHSLVTAEDDEDLFIWAQNIRKTYRGKRRQDLGAEKIKALEDLNFSWSSSQQTKQRNQPKTTPHNGAAAVRQRKWQEYYPQLEDFHAIYGHCNVTAKDDKDLHRWVTSLRKNYHCQAIVRDLAPSAMSSSTSTNSRSASPLLSDEQFEALQALDFSWSTRKQKLRKGMTKAKTWDEYFPRLVEFYRTHGHCNVTLSEDDDQDHKDLYEWRQSLPYRRYTEEKAELLQQLGVSLAVEARATWKPLHRKEMIDKLHAFYDKHGHVVVTANDNDPELYEWTQRFIRSHTYKKLCQLVIPNYSKTRKDEKWDAMFVRLKEYHKKNGHFNIRGDSKLYNFVQNQRKQYRKLVRGEHSQLTMERIEALEQIGFEWGKSHDIRWQERIEELDTFAKIYGHPVVPQEFKDNPKLGTWVMNQRTLHRKKQSGELSNLRKDRSKDLESRDFVWDVRDKHWWDRLEMVKKFQEEHGHLNMPASDPAYDSLRQWLSEQRHFYRSEKFQHRLTEQRVEALESIPGFEWRGRFSKAPSKAEWADLLKAMREKGISPEAKSKKHWFDGVNPFEQEVKTVWTEEDIMALWNEEEDEEDAEDYYYEDDDSKNFLRA